MGDGVHLVVEYPLMEQICRGEAPLPEDPASAGLYCLYASMLVPTREEERGEYLGGSVGAKGCLLLNPGKPKG
jgi:hypothetical protein